MIDLLALPYDIRERIAFVAISARIHAVYRSAVYTATLLQNERFERCRLSCRFSLSYNARHQRIMLSSLRACKDSDIESHGLVWYYFPNAVRLIPIGFVDRSSFTFTVRSDGVLIPAEFNDPNAAVTNADGQCVYGDAITIIAQNKYERLLRSVVHYQATEIQRVFRGARARDAFQSNQIG